MLSLISAPSGYGKTYTVISEIKELLKKGSDRKIFVIVPEQESVKMEAELLTSLGNTINKNIEVLNFSRLANRVFREAGGMTYSYIDNCGKDLLTAVILENMKKTIPSFSQKSDDINYIKLIREEMDLMRQKGIYPKDLERVRLNLSQMDKGGKNFDEKLQDFSLIFSTYEKMISSEKRDSVDDMNRLAKTLADFDFFEDSYVFIDGFYDYTTPQYSVIEEIIKGAYHTTVTFSLSLSDPDNIFRKTRLAYDTIRNLAEKNGVEYTNTELKENYRTNNPLISLLADNLMSGRTDRYTKEAQGVTVTQVPTPYDECVFVAREIVKLVKNGASFSDIAIISSSLDEYGTMLESVLETYGINYLNCTEISPITEPIVSLVLTAIDTVNSHFYYKNVKTYLKSPYLSLTPKEAFLLENYITMWSLKYRAWESEEDWTMHPRGYVEVLTDSDRKELEEVNNARNKIYLPLKKLAEGLKSQIIEKKIRAIVEFLDELKVYEQISKDNEEERSSWNLLVSAFEHIVSVAGELKVTRERFSKYMRLVLGDMSFGKIPSSIDEVELGEVGFVRNKKIKFAFFIGFNEGMFPKLSQTSSVFSESERRWLKENDIVIEESTEEKLKDQTFMFLLALFTASDSISFVYHTKSESSTKAVLLPSYFYSILKDTFDCPIEKFVFDKAIPVTKKELEGFMLVNKNEQTSALVKNEFPDLDRTVSEFKRFKDCYDKLFFIDKANDFIKDNYPMTQSRLERFERCRFSYFVEYMLKARTRKPAKFSNAEIGSYVHKILEMVLKQLTVSNITITEAETSQIAAITEKTAGEYIQTVFPDIATDSPKYKYLVDNITAFAVFVIENIRDEFSSSLFKPKLFEENLGDSEEVKPYEVKLKDGTTLTFYGIIDRVDTYVDENGVEYIRVVDYKTKSGGKSFSLEDVINGMNIQMLIYLFAMTSTPSKNERKAAGIMYMPAGKTDFKPTDNEIDDVKLKLDIDKSLKRSGMYLDDKRILDAMESGEEKRFIDLKFDKKTESYSDTTLSTLVQLEAFGLIERYINSLFNDVMTTLKSGDIFPEPLEESSGRSSCDWCSFKPICRYEGEKRKKVKEKYPLEYMKSVLKE